MAYINKKGEIELTREDEDSLRMKDKLHVDSLMNWIIWGDPKGFTRNFKKK